MTVNALPEIFGSLAQIAIAYLVRHSVALMIAAPPGLMAQRGLASHLCDRSLLEHT
jgi:hypothetical protein